MPDPSAHDRDLLFALLAMQTDFVERPALVETIAQWAETKARPLAEVLVERGALRAEYRALLEPLVDAHVARHGDATRSLAVAAHPSSRDSPAAADIRAILDSTQGMATVSHASDPATSATASRGQSDPTVPRFRVLRAHARGGLGQVYVAKDQELGRQVALKEIRAEYAGDAAARSRFLLEAEINGNLEHPSIVPVYGLGHYADGRPFYAMRFVEGDSLHEAVAAYHRAAPDLPAAERSLRLRHLLRRFVDVCEAIAYAHSRGVLHRDLKPANIMLGKYGETLLIDWGLAKATGRVDPRSGGTPEDSLVPPSGDSFDRTRMGSALGTPHYMSPEQASGEVDRLGPATDVYGLGATLYALLCGRPPIEAATLTELLEKVRRGEVRPVREANPGVPRALGAVCLKAMALEPADRYPTALDVAQDIERWLADEPVSAYREPLFARAGRWIRRHRTAATAAAAVALMSLAGTAVAYRREAAHAAKLDLANRETSRWLDRAMGSIREYYTGVSAEALRGGVLPARLRDRLLEKPRSFYEQIAAELSRRPNPGERERTLLADARLGLGTMAFHLGRLSDARRELDASLALRRALAAARPGDAAVRRDLAMTLNAEGMVLRDAGEPRGAAEADREAITIRERLVGDAPGDLPLRYELAVSYFNLGVLAFDRDEAAEARAMFDKAIVAAAVLVAAEPAKADYRNMLASSLSNLGEALRMLGLHDESGRAQRRAIDLLEPLVREQPQATDPKDRLARAHLRMSDWYSVDDESGPALRSQRRAVELYDELAAAEPGVPVHRVWLEKSRSGLAIALAEAGDLPAAVAEFRAAIDVGRRLAKDNPDTPGIRSELGGSLSNLADALDQAGEPREALAAVEEAISLQRPLVERHPGVRRFRGYLIIHHHLRARILRNLGRAADSARATRDGLALRPGDAEAFYDAACDLSLCVPVAATPAEATLFADEAIAMLRRAIALGWSDPAGASTDSDLDPIRSRPEFSLLLAPLFDKMFPRDPFASTRAMQE